MGRQLEETRFRIGDLTVDLEEFAVLRQGGGAVELPRLSFDLLVALARRAPAVVSADELIATVWAGVAVSNETLTQRVALLRRALGDEAKSPRYLRAVRGRGYQLVPAVVAAPAAPASALGAANAGRTGSVRRSPATVAVFAALAALGVAVVVLLVATFGRFASPPSQSARGGGASSRGDEPSSAPPAPGVAGGAAEPADLVATRSPTAPELLRRADAYLAQHQEANNELAIELYQRALQLEPQNPQALAGLSLALSQRATKFNQHEAAGEALALAQRAVAFAPRLGRAHHALGLARDSRGEVRAALAAYLHAASLEPQPAAALASAANLLQVEGHLAAALELDVRAARESAGDTPPLYLEVQVGGTLAALGFEPAATVWFDRALELRPDNVFAASAYAAARLSQGRVHEADAIAARAIARGIRRPELADIRGTVALLAGDTARAKELFAQALAISPHDLRAHTRLLVLALDGPVSPFPAAAAGTAGAAGTVTGAVATGGGAAAERRRREVRALIEDLHRGRAEGDEWPESGLDEALLETAAGNGSAALQALDAAIALGYRDVGWLELDPMLAPLRRDPRFGERLARIRRLLEGERQRVGGAPWLPPGLLAGSAARM